MKLKALVVLHKRVVHDEWETIGEFDSELEKLWIKRYPYDVLESVCSDCFSDPDAEVTL